MKLFNFGEIGAERAGVVDGDGKLRDLSAHLPRIDVAAITDGFDALTGIDLTALPLVQENARIGACVLNPPTFYCIGLNYAAHADESGMPYPTEPLVFSKAASALAGPNDDLVLAPDALKADWEVELGVVIGARGWQVDAADAMDIVAGYCVVNDLSERAWQLEGTGQWIKGKSAPGFGPIGPYLVTKDEVGDPGTLDLWLSLNGDRLQNSNTSDLIFDIPQIIAHMSQRMLLLPGDVIATGTPAGVGMGLQPQRYLRDGDVMELGVEGLGTQRQVVQL
ncbi:fumarylacetoacetate hydrolase family protein [Pontivivens nitratireducens]|uniref:fumarylacetoacetate hydrolase family protein n=1 Tax=Pontivivens nitratireducens TaxID=2758038 RepID=UPI001639966C|nr:fumarylacetoacetate hydrolase family protein [Pontibrevibacter nitratireducens]